MKKPYREKESARVRKYTSDRPFLYKGPQEQKNRRPFAQPTDSLHNTNFSLRRQKNDFYFFIIKSWCIVIIGGKWILEIQHLNVFSSEQSQQSELSAARN